MKNEMNEEGATCKAETSLGCRQEQEKREKKTKEIASDLSNFFT